jgi:TolA-binding protein
MLDDRLSKIRAAMTPPWDEMHETRLLGRIQGERRRNGSRRTRIAVMLATSAVAATAALGYGLRTPEPGGAAGSARGVPARASRSSTESSLTFTDGSVAMLGAGARVRTETQTDERVELRQEGGRVRYRVVPDAKREFKVRARGVTVAVIGTEFVVDVADDGVHVHVDRGRVRVFDGTRDVELSANERLSILSSAQTAAADAGLVPQSGPAASTVPTVEELLARADAARQAGRLADAASALRTLTLQHRTDPRAVSALFTLGKVQRAQGRHAQAALAFRSARARAPGGSLAEDSLAEEASSWSSAGNGSNSVAAAKEYVARYPSGTHAERMRRLLE